MMYPARGGLDWVRRGGCHLKSGSTPPKGGLYNILHVATKQPELASSRLRCLGCPSRDGLSTLTIHDNHPDEAGNRHRVGQTVGAFHRSRHWSVELPA